MDNQEIAVKQNDELGEIQRLANIFVRSGFFKDTKDLAQACVKILAGRELGLSPMASMSGVYIVEGKPTLSANLMSSRINSAGFRHEVVKLTETECELDFFQGNRKLGTSSFTWKDAEKAGLANRDVWKKYPRNMLFARAMSNGARWYCSAAFGGQAVYTPEELGLAVDRDGEHRGVVSRVEARLTDQIEVEKV